MADYGATTEQPIDSPKDFNPDKYQSSEEYQHGLCSCSDNCGNCCLVLWCFPIAGCIAANKLAENMCYGICFGVLPLSVRFRSVAHIEQGMCDEGCQWLFCPCCAMCRMLNEMDSRSFQMERS